MADWTSVWVSIINLWRFSILFFCRCCCSCYPRFEIWTLSNTENPLASIACREWQKSKCQPMLLIIFFLLSCYCCFYSRICSLRLVWIVITFLSSFYKSLAFNCHWNHCWSDLVTGHCLRIKCQALTHTHTTMKQVDFGARLVKGKPYNIREMLSARACTYFRIPIC